jgi:hypothetical protein
MAAPRLQVVWSSDGTARSGTNSDSSIRQRTSSEISTGRESPEGTFSNNNQDPEDIDLEQLYPASRELSTTLGQALILLSQCLKRIDSAIEYYRADENILSDDQVHHLLVLLDELFCLHEISEGFASIVNACNNGIRNMGGGSIK